MKAPDGIYIFRELESEMLANERGLFDSVQSFQEKLLKRLQREYSKLLDTDSGLIIKSSDNIRKMRDIRRAIDRLMKNKEYVEAVRDSTAKYSAVTSNLNNYFSFIADEFAVDSVFVKESLSEARKVAVNMMMGEGLNINFKSKLEQIIIDGINNGSPLSALNESMSDYLTKDGGGLARYSKQITTDTLNTFSRTYTNQVADGLGLEHYFYSGTEIKTTRDFCDKRIGNYYTKKDVEGWADNRWQGKKKGTDKDTIFTYLGGYNCRHKLVPVSERMYNLNT